MTTTDARKIKERKGIVTSPLARVLHESYYSHIAVSFSFPFQRREKVSFFLKENDLSTDSIFSTFVSEGAERVPFFFRPTAKKKIEIWLLFSHHSYSGLPVAKYLSPFCLHSLSVLTSSRQQQIAAPHRLRWKTLLLTARVLACMISASPLLSFSLF